MPAKALTYSNLVNEMFTEGAVKKVLDRHGIPESEELRQKMKDWAEQNLHLVMAATGYYYRQHNDRGDKHRLPSTLDDPEGKFYLPPHPYRPEVSDLPWRKYLPFADWVLGRTVVKQYPTP